MKKLLLGLILAVSLFNVASVSYVKAAGQCSGDCTAPCYIPSACTKAYNPGVSGGYTADINCATKSILDPSILNHSSPKFCCPNKCVDSNGNDAATATGEDTTFKKFEVFGTTFRVNPNNVGTIINIIMISILGAISVYVLIRGIYVAGIKRTMAVTDEEIANLNKELTNLVIGFIICWGFIIVIQLVANLLGVGSLSNLDISGGNGGGLVVTVQ